MSGAGASRTRYAPTPATSPPPRALGLHHTQLRRLAERHGIAGDAATNDGDAATNEAADERRRPLASGTRASLVPLSGLPLRDLSSLPAGIVLAQCVTH